MFKVDNKNTRKTSVFFQCFHCWLRKSKFQLTLVNRDYNKIVKIIKIQKKKYKKTVGNFPNITINAQFCSKFDGKESR